MNILFYFEQQINPTRGGTERVTFLVSNYLKQQGHNIFYIARYPVADERSVASVFLPMEGNVKTNVDFINNFIEANRIEIIVNEAGFNQDVYLFSHSNIRGNVKIISCLHFDITGELDAVYQTFNYSLKYIPLNEKILKIRNILSLPYLKFCWTKERNERYRFMYAQSDRVVLLCKNYVERYRKVAGLSDCSKLTVALNPNTFEITNEEYKKQNSVIYVGRVVFPQKRIDRILKVWKVLNKQHSDWSLYIVGDGDYRPQAEEWVRRNRLSNVVFTGFANPESYYRSAKILLLASAFEGTPMVIPEAMSYGVVPVVMHNFAGATVHIQTGYNGFLTPTQNIKAMAEKADFLMTHEDARTRMAAQAKESIRPFDIETTGKQWDQLLYDLSDERKQ
jgi:glycosyltransferase involved in cell wall biosynthesis